MNGDQLEAQVSELMKDVHPVLAAKLESIASDRGRSAGRDEVLGILRGLKDEFYEINNLLLT